MEGVPTDGPPTGGQRFRWVFGFCIEGDLRFISHHDTLRMLRRTLARADFPVRFSEGFNPHPKVMIPLPRPVGIASEVEVVVLETDRPIDPSQALVRLQAASPGGLRFTTGREFVKGESVTPVRATYLLDTQGAPSDEVRRRVEELRAADSAVITRTDAKSKVSRAVDIRPSIESIETGEAGVEFTIRIGSGGAAKPAEVAGWIGFDSATINHRITRTKVDWQTTE